MISKISIPVCSFFFVVSVCFNIYFLMGKGIVVNKDYRVTNNNNNSQWQGQLLLNMWAAQGDKIEWKYKKYSDFNNIEELIAFRNSLHPISSMFSKRECIVSLGPKDYEYLVWPDIFTKTKDKQVQKQSSGDE